MPYVWMDEVQRVQTVSADGIGVSPAIPVSELASVSDEGKSMVKSTPANSLPNPNVVNSGDTIVSDNGAWSGAAPMPPEICVVTGTTDDDTGATTLDKTYAEISAAVSAGKLVYLISVTADGVVDGGLDIAYLAVSFIGVSSDVYTVVFGTEDLYKANTEDEALVDADHFVPADDGDG